MITKVAIILNMSQTLIEICFKVKHLTFKCANWQVEFGK